MPEHCTLHGYLLATLCGTLQIQDRIGGAEVIAVHSEREASAAETSLAARQDLKTVVQRVSEDDLNRLVESTNLVLRATTDDEGQFCIEQPDYAEADYAGGALDVYVVIPQVPYLQDGDRQARALDEAERLFLGTYRPAASGDDVWTLNLLLPREVYCALKRQADVWTIVGRVTACEAQVPIAGLLVTAFDVDLTQHDNLGTATTNGAGHFRIDYLGDLYREGTFIDVELFGGPDLFFNIEDSDGNVLLDEPRSRGRADDRENVGPCFCVELCVPVPVGPQTPVPAVWTDVGKARFAIPDGLSTNDFDADGYGVAGSTHYAFTGGALKMMGSVPYLSDPYTVEYRFLVSETPGVNGGAPPSAASFTRTVGAGADADLFVDGVVLGRVIRLAPSFKIVKVRARKADLDPNGWLDIKKAIERAFVEDPDVTPADIPGFIGAPYGGWDPDVLLALDTRKLAPATSPGSGLSAGDNVPPSEEVDVTDGKVALRFEIRLRNTATAVTTDLPASGTTLNALMLDNTNALRLLEMVDHTTDACQPLSGSVDVAYTVYHPHLSSVNVNVRSNDGSFNKNLDDVHLPFSVAADANGTDPMSNGALTINTSQLVPPGDPQQPLHRCTYLVTLGLSWRLHTGDGGVALGDPQTTFFYEG